MDVKWLEDFVALARTRSFSAAARERHVTQPAFSRRIRALESWAGVSLVDRSSHPIAITAAGRKFRETAEETIRMLGSARDDLRARSDTVRPTVFVAALHTLATGFFPHWLSEMQAKAGAFNSRLMASDYQSCIASISHGDCDFMLTFWHADVPAPLDPLVYPYLTVGLDSMVEVYAAGKTANAGPILRYSRESFLGRLPLPPQSIENGRGEVTHTSENAMAEGLKSMVLAGHGTAWLPRSLVHSELADGRLATTGRHLPLEIRLLRNVDRRRSIVQSIWDCSAHIMQDMHKVDRYGIGRWPLAPSIHALDQG